ncbi:hypothetical protein LBO01_20110 [Companilactobacillus paralimentarius]|nr:hypothetical protein LBO01_20110 [Companilactobacillus paralimentarius]
MMKSKFFRICIAIIVTFSVSWIVSIIWPSGFSFDSNTVKTLLIVNICFALGVLISKCQKE